MKNTEKFSNTKNLTFGIALCASIDRDKLR